MLDTAASSGGTATAGSTIAHVVPLRRSVVRAPEVALISSSSILPASTVKTLSCFPPGSTGPFFDSR